jgi:hypothetical protein
MGLRHKNYFIIFGIFASLLFLGDVRAEELQPSEGAAPQETVAGPDQHSMTLVSFHPWVLDGEVVGAVAEYVYDDVKTDRPADYWEVYDKEGHLLAVTWLDQQGIQKTAVDRGIVEDKDKLEGVFVIIIEGESI